MRRPPAIFLALLAVCALAPASCAGDEEGATGSGSSSAESPAADTEAETGSEPTETERAPGEPGEDADSPAEDPEDPAAEFAPPSSESSRIAAARATLTTFFAGVGAKDARKVCGTFSRQLGDLVGSAVGSDCVGGMTAAFALLVPAGVEDAFASIKVRRLTVNGNEATAELRLPAKIRALGAFGFVARDDKVRLKRENGSWLLAPPVF